jgi:hypothetical protein
MRVAAPSPCNASPPPARPPGTERAAIRALLSFEAVSEVVPSDNWVALSDAKSGGNVAISSGARWLVFRIIGKLFGDCRVECGVSRGERSAGVRASLRAGARITAML